MITSSLVLESNTCSIKSALLCILPVTVQREIVINSLIFNPLGAGGLFFLLGNLFFIRFYTRMAKLLEIDPINHIYLER
jgi:hypothetical protein